MLLKNAKSITVREKYSEQIAKEYNDNVTLYHDFAFDILDRVEVKKE
jgi:polysaccharide pyruvyl transferase WcaK-like protein